MFLICPPDMTTLLSMKTVCYTLRLVACFLLPFSLIAQTDCEGFDIDIFQHPFNTDLLVLEVSHPGNEAFNYPSWKLFQDGTEVGADEVVFFVMPEHAFFMLDPEIEILEGTSYDFELELYTLFGESLACTFQWSGIPYEATECFETTLNFYSSGGFIEQELEFQLLDQSGELLVNDNVFFQFGTQQVTYPVCLPRECYTIRLEAVGATLQNNMLVNISTDGHLWFNELAEAGSSEYVFEADLWEGCSIVSAPGIEKQPTSKGTMILPPGRAFNPSWGFCLTGRMQVFATNGSLVSEGPARELKTPMEGGFYLIVTTKESGEKSLGRIYIASGEDY